LRALQPLAVPVQRAVGVDGKLDVGRPRIGRSMRTECVSSGAVMMKITSSTSITSMSGIMLISAIGRCAPSWSKPPKLIGNRRSRSSRRS
jgi:hypothetical protein